jgi:hypothetical protein
MSSLMDMAKDIVHDRIIETKTYYVDDDHILCAGKLRETRHVDYYKFTGEKVEAGILHGLTILLLIKVPSLIIEEIEVSMDNVPRFECKEVEQCLAPVKGMAITGGFSSKVREIAGGEKGCTHLLHLIITMAPAVLQGFWASRYRKKPDVSSVSNASARMGNAIKNTCHVWREDGPAFQKLKKIIEEKNGSPDRS